MRKLPSIILASTSPRRKELLSLAGIDFEIRVAQVREDYSPRIAPAQVPEYLAKKKATAAQSLCEETDIILAADTIVLAGGIILGKPKSLEEAKRYLRILSGRSHEVITGVCLLQGNRVDSFSEHTRVFFRELLPEEIDYYVDIFRPLDKAGAYAIQEWIGIRGVERIEGDYFNVVGLPVSHLTEHLSALKFQ